MWSAAASYPHFPTHLSQDVFSLSRCKSALPMAALRKVGVPLPPDQVELLEENVGWEEFKVGVGGQGGVQGGGGRAGEGGDR